MKLYFSTFFYFILIISCTLNQEKYNKKKWNLKDDVGYYSYREPMLNDLLKNHKIKGLNINELNNLFGKIEIDPTNKNKIFFNIVTDYGWDIDPVYTKDLILILNQNQIVIDYKIIEWNKD